MTLSPRIRAFQQTYAYHVIKSAIWAGLTAGLTAYFGVHPDTALAVAAMTFLGTLESGIEHSPGSSDFASNGTTIDAVPQLKELVDNTITVHAQAKDPNFPTVTPANAANATAAVDTAVQAVNVQNAIVKDALANEVKS